MKQRLLHSLYASVEWRIVAFLITNAFLWLATGEFVRSTLLAIELHLILLVAHFVWFFLRQEGRSA